MSDLLPFIVVGAATGSLYGLAGVGLVLTYRTSGVFNFAHGAIAAGAAFLFYTLHIQHGIAWPLAAISVTAAFALGVGPVFELVTRSLSGAAETLSVMVTVGLMLAVQGFLLIQYGTVPRHFEQFLPESGFSVAGVLVSWAQVIAAVFALGCVGALCLFLDRSRLGVLMRAVVDNSRLVRLTGEQPIKVRRTAWSIGAAFAAVSGILLAPTLGLDATLLTFVVVQAFGACAIGRFKSLPVTYVGGLVIGIGASVLTRYFTAPPYNGLPPSVPFIALIVALLAVRSRKRTQPGLAIRVVVSASSVVSRSGRQIAGASLAGCAALVAVPSFAGARLPVWTNGLTYFVLFASLALLVWTSGQISLCHAAFFALGASTMGHLSGRGVPWPIAVLLAGLAVMPIGALVALPAIRLSGIYLALVTLGFGILMQNVVFQTSLMFGAGGNQTVTASRPAFGPIEARNDTSYFYVALVIAALMCAALVGVQRSRLGRLLRGMSESPTLLVAHGLSLNLTRLLVFSISAFAAGVAGALNITQFGSVSPIAFGPVQSLVLVAVLALSGTSLLRSAAISALLFAVVPGYADGFDTEQQLLAFGLAAAAAALVLARRDAIEAWLQGALARDERRLRASPVSARQGKSAARVAGSTS